MPIPALPPRILSCPDRLLSPRCPAARGSSSSSRSGSCGSRTSTCASSSIPTKAATPRSRARCGQRRLGDAATRRHQVFREAAAAVLADGRELQGVRAGRMDGTPSRRARRIPDGPVRRLRRLGDRVAGCRRLCGRRARRMRVAVRHRAHRDARCAADVLADARARCVPARAALARRRPGYRGAGCWWRGRRRPAAC